MFKNLSLYGRELIEKLWFKPLIFCLCSVAAALLAHLADDSFIVNFTPNIEKSSVEELLSTISASMLVISIFAVGAMLSAFSAAGSTATPRSFKLIVADDVSQNALSVFIGSFIYSNVATLALKNGFYGKAGYFTLFLLTILVFIVVILTFLRWFERISKLGRLNHTIQNVEEATVDAIKKRKADPYVGGIPLTRREHTGIPIMGSKIGYVQEINMRKLQELALEADATIILHSVPGTFTAADKPLVYLLSDKQIALESCVKLLEEAFVIKEIRSFKNDPRFGLIALSEIASRALSPGINDPGTAIAVIGSHVRIFSLWLQGEEDGRNREVKYNRVEVPEISLHDMLEDAFRPIARDGASNVEVMIRLQKAFISLAFIGSSESKALVIRHSLQALARAEQAITFKQDLELLMEQSAINSSKINRS